MYRAMSKNTFLKYGKINKGIKIIYQNYNILQEQKGAKRRYM